MSSPGESRREVAGTGRGSKGTRRLFSSPYRIFALALVLTFLNMAAWSFATPLFASPDEPAHVVKAIALEHGQLIGTPVKSSTNAYTIVDVPELYANATFFPDCFKFKSTIAASCTHAFSGSGKIVSTITYVGRYPPLYYAIVGLPSLFTSSPHLLYFMRLTSALLSAIFLALAVTSVAAWSRNRLLLIGVLLAATPMSIFLASVVNPSGIEITSAICLWTSGLVLALERAQKPPPGLVAIVVAATSMLLLTRGLSPLWVAVIFMALAVLAGRHAVSDFARARVSRWSLLVLVPVAIFAVLYIALAHTLDLAPGGKPIGSGVDVVQLVANIFGNTGYWLKQMVGVFGWLDTFAPLATYIIWCIAVGFVALAALISARARHVVVLLGVTAVVIAVPVAIAYSQVHTLGIDWQGRYIMPMAVGIPLVSVALLDRSDVLRQARLRLSTVLCLLIGIGQFVAFAQALRRYTVGVSGPIDYLSGKWHPPLGALTLTLGSLGATVLLMVMVRYLIGRAHHKEDGSGAGMLPVEVSSGS